MFFVFGDAFFFLFFLQLSLSSVEKPISMSADAASPPLASFATARRLQSEQEQVASQIGQPWGQILSLLRRRSPKSIPKPFLTQDEHQRWKRDLLHST